MTGILLSKTKSCTGECMKKRDKVSIYTCYGWFLQNISDEELKKRGCTPETIETMHILHKEIVNGLSHSNTKNSRKVTTSNVTFMERLYRGEPKRNTQVASAYKTILEGLSLEDFTKVEIEKAQKFKDEYQGRSMFSHVVARELDISVGAAKRMQQYCKDFCEGKYAKIRNN